MTLKDYLMKKRGERMEEDYSKALAAMRRISERIGFEVVVTRESGAGGVPRPMAMLDDDWAVTASTSGFLYLACRRCNRLLSGWQISLDQGLSCLPSECPLCAEGRAAQLGPGRDATEELEDLIRRIAAEEARAVMEEGP